MKKSKGFTLIEVIVVLIIVGVLAAMTLASIFSNIKKSYAAQAFLDLKNWRDQIEICVQVHPGTESVCNNIAYPQSPYCAYAMDLLSDGNPDYGVYAHFYPNVLTTPDNILVTRRGGNTTNPTYTYTCQGVFQGLC